MFIRLLFAECDVCGKRILLKECNSISTSSVKLLRNFYKWLVCRNGRFVCDECRCKTIFPLDWNKILFLRERIFGL